MKLRPLFCKKILNRKLSRIQSYLFRGSLVYAAQNLQVLLLDQVVEIIIGQSGGAVCAALDQIVVQHIRIRGILPAHLLVPLFHLVGEGKTAWISLCSLGVL